MKTNDEAATLRSGNLPKADAVKTATADAGAHCAAVKSQTESNEPGIDNDKD